MLSYAVLCYLKRHVQKKPEKQKIDFQNPPRPLPKPLQIHPKSSPRGLLAASWTLLGPLGNKALKKEAQKCPKRRQGGPKPFPKPSQNPPQTSRKSIKKRMRKIHGFGKRFFQDFLQFWLPKSLIFQ